MEMMHAGYPGVDRELRVYYLYLAIQSLNDWGIDFGKSINTSAIEADIFDRKESAVYSLGLEDYPSLCGTYYCLYILKNIERY